MTTKGNVVGYLFTTTMRGSEYGRTLPYWLTEEDAELLARRHGGTKECFFMALPGFGVMHPVPWQFVPAEVDVCDPHSQRLEVV